MLQSVIKLVIRQYFVSVSCYSPF